MGKAKKREIWRGTVNKLSKSGTWFHPSFFSVRQRSGWFRSISRDNAEKWCAYVW